MEKNVFKYLEILLPKHGCVTIPNLGGFIVNTEAAYISAKGKILPPKYFIVFNPELKYDDGILSSYIIQDENISYNAARTKLKFFVETVKIDTNAGKIVEFGRLGHFKLDDNNNLAFISSREITHPAYWGLYPSEIERLANLRRSIHIERRNISLKYSISTVAATVAAICLFFLPSNTIKDSSNNISLQGASFISSINDISSPLLSNKESKASISTEVKSESTENVSTRTYYIIIGSEESKKHAEVLLNRAKNAGFENAAIVESPDRLRIYVSSFNDKTQAEFFLETFRKENPKYETAWLFSKRNK